MIANTRDFSKFGARERSAAGQLLTALHTGNDKTSRLENTGIAIEFNLNSGMVFLVDEEHNVAVMEGDKLVDFLSCPECGTEGTVNDFYDTSPESCCVDYLGELYVP